MEKRKTFDEWEKEFGFALYSKKTKLTESQYLTLKRKQQAWQGIRSVLIALNKVGLRVTRNFGYINGFESEEK